MLCSHNDDNKYAKFAVSESQSLSLLKLQNITWKDVGELFRSPVHVYGCFLMACSILYYMLGGSLMEASMPDKLGMASTIMETLGLLMLQHKIAGKGNVKGISGMTMGIYAIVYTLRQFLLVPSFTLYELDAWTVETLQFPSIVIVFDVLRSVFITQRKTYDEEQDVLSMKCLVPCCAIMAVVACPRLSPGLAYSVCWSFYVYLDVFALMPQVVMMARGGGKVEAPIAHFVAATAVRWMVDLWFWTYNFDLGPQGYYKGVNISGLIIIGLHVLSLLLIADFMYYYVKSRLMGNSFSDSLNLPVDEV